MKISLIKPNSVNVNAWTECFKNNGIEVLENKVERRFYFSATTGRKL